MLNNFPVVGGAYLFYYELWISIILFYFKLYYKYYTILHTLFNINIVDLLLFA